jgi:hypothetical protein
MIDAQTLAEVKAAAETYTGGLKVKTDHYSGFNEIVGTLKNFTIDGDQLRADLHLLKNHEATARILEMAELMPDTFGLSISFTGQHEDQGEAVFARCSEIYSADLVDAPAANPTGLFSAKVDSAKMAMDEKQIAETIASAIAEALAPVEEKLAAFESFMADYAKDEEKMEEKSEDEALQDEPKVEIEVEKEDMSAKLAAELAEIKALVTNFGAKPVAPSVAVEAKDEPKTPTTFAEALESIKAEGLNGAAATKAAITRYPALYLEARNAGIKTL